MNRQNINKLKSDKGFTIVELLIVIVVIGILAAIVIVAYQGVTSRANTTKNTSTASAIQKKAEAFNSDSAGTTGTQSGNGYYPATAAIFNAVPNDKVGGLPAGVTVQAGAPTATTQTAIRYTACAATAGATAATGYYVGFWNYTDSAVNYIAGGTATVNAAGTVPACTAPAGTPSTT